MGRVLFGIFLGVALVAGGIGVWLYRGKVPVAVTDAPLPLEDKVTSTALNARVNRELIQMPPIQPDDHNLTAGAQIYMDQCALCHGTRGHSAPLGENMFPAAPPLWERHANGPAVGVSDDAPGETYWKVANGIRLSGMPEFRSALTNNEMWQVSLLLSHADKPLPAAVVTILRLDAGLAKPAPKPVQHKAAPKPDRPADDPNTPPSPAEKIGIPNPPQN